MPVIITPGELNRRADFYHQLQQLTSAGLGLVRALDQLRKNPPSRSYRSATEQLLYQINQGQALGESMRAIPDWLPDFDITLIEAGEKSGRLDQCFRMLGEYYVERTKVAKRVISALVYPAFLLHVLAVVMVIVLFFWYPKLCILPFLGLFGVYVLVFILIYAAQHKHSEAWRAKVEFILNMVPVVGTARRQLALGRLSAALEALISAGVTIIEAWQMAAKASGSIALQRTVESWIPELRAGRTPAEMIQESGKFPEIFANQYVAGEVSGKLDETLQRIGNYYQENGGQKVQLLAQWVPILIYLGVLVGGGAFIVWFWITYYGKLWQEIGI